METISLIKTLGALGLVLGLIAVAAFLARHFFGASGYGRRRDERRLSVVEALTLDARRRVLLVRCDATEHLVLLGSNSEAVLTPRSDVAMNPAAAAPPPIVREPSPEGPQWRATSPRAPYRRDEPVLGPLPPRGR
jgi:flagellar protein FliO/FliZ